MNDLFSKVVALAKRRGFVFPSCEIYGGLANTYDYGHYGTLLKENIKQLWFKRFFETRQDMYRIESSIILNSKVWEASGHIETFADVMVEDLENHKRYRADHLIEEHFSKLGQEVVVDGKSATELQEIIEKEGISSPDGNKLSEAKKFNLLFETEIGIIEGAGNRAFLRGEIAQGIFLNFKNILDSMSPKLPFGIGQAGKAFRNEITKGQFTFRTLEFDLMEFEYFFDPSQDDWQQLFEYWKNQIFEYALSCGINPDNLRWRQHEEFELSHYSKGTEDLEYKFPWGYKEMFACAYRTDFDLFTHQEKSGQKLNYTYPDGKKLIPHVIEPTFGLSRFMTILLMDTYKQDTQADESREYLALSPAIAPVKIAVFPLVKKEPLQKIAKEIIEKFSSQFNVEYSQTGSIGKRYRKQDEIGTPYCITVDFDSLEDASVTVRDRDTLEQQRIAVDKLGEFFTGKF
ncbi:glycine--tRNA ligase [bacterium]|jgi:glycyl-tRNA synthetase|nr:glycine--tRNA ligase [bacterium]